MSLLCSSLYWLSVRTRGLIIYSGIVTMFYQPQMIFGFMFLKAKYPQVMVEQILQIHTQHLNLES